MVRTCICCKYRVNKLQSDISLYGFPKDGEILEKWLSAIGTAKKVSESTRICSRHFKEVDFRYSLVGGNRFLKHGAVPSLHLNEEAKDERSSDSQESQVIISEEDRTVNKILNITDLQTGLQVRNDNRSLHIIKRKEEATARSTCEHIRLGSHSEPQASESRLSPLLPGQSEQKRTENKRKKCLYDVSWEEISTSPVQAKIYWEVVTGKINRQKVVLKTLRQKVRRLKKRITKLQSLVKRKKYENK
ncbi:PREDICTED: uncharacterized protein LOC106743657 isoform X2 [Dinoponera quadriceps]|uniref:Uncharacterized protein LOC106743657 isoform X2 n=1 Tax=Dinoponera quadriceps TaxID=609295 RepID=A0A6P3X5M3_DINQU|nr:PREDICTED: uncharacterized protein LOC106743657 isoform X2 [Dinoponera quadriceps]